MRNYREAIRRKETEVLGQSAEAAGCRLAAVAPRWPPGRAGGRAGALLLSLHPCTCMLLRISCDFFLSFPFFFFSFIFPSRPRRLQPSRLLSMKFPSKDTGVGCHFLLQGFFLTQGLSSLLLYWQADSLPLSHLGSPLDTDG